jgi:hypothetical protein
MVIAVFLNLLLLFMVENIVALNGPFPIQFCVPECKIVKEIPVKDRDFAYIIPGKLDTYIYTKEEDYYKDYQRSYFAITCKKGGWDCLRHYEILANGCIPYFLNLNDCPQNTMYFLPKDLIKEAMSLEGVSYLGIDHSRFDKNKYYSILNKLLDYTRKYLTTKSIAQYFLDTINYSGQGKILLLTEITMPGYMQTLLLIGLKELLGDKIIEYPKADYIYTSYSGNILNLYGKGFTYSRIIEDQLVDRSNLEQRIRNKEFEFIVYGLVHYNKSFYDLVKSTYEQEKIIYVCGEDSHNCKFKYLSSLFLREW